MSDKEVVQSGEWKSAIPEDVKGDPYWSRFEGKSLSDVLKSSVEANNYAAGAMKIPGSEATPEDWDKFYSKTRPATPTDYKLDLDKEIGWEDPALDQFKSVAHKYGVSDKQLQGLLNEGYAPLAKSALAQQQQAMEEQERQAKIELGDNYQAKLNDTERLFKRMGKDEVFESLKQSDLIHNSKALEVFSEMANMFDEDTIVGDTKTRWQSPVDIQAEIDKRRADKTDPLNNVNHPHHTQAIKDLQNLYVRLQAVA